MLAGDQLEELAGLEFFKFIYSDRGSYLSWIIYKYFWATKKYKHKMYTVYVFFFSLLLCLFCYVFCNLIQSRFHLAELSEQSVLTVFVIFLKAVPRTASFLTILSTICHKAKLYSLREWTSYTNNTISPLVCMIINSNIFMRNKLFGEALMPNSINYRFINFLYNWS